MSSLEQRKKGPGGRPTIYDPKRHPQAAYRACILGCTNQELADKLGISIGSVEEWLRVHKEFSMAVKSGREGADEDIAGALYTKALNGDVTAQIFWLKNRRTANWRDRKDIDVNATVRHSVEEFSDAELASIAAGGSERNPSPQKSKTQPH